MSAEYLRSADELVALGAGWDDLAESQPDPFSTSTWLAAWWRAFAPDRPGEVLVLRRGSAVAAGLPLLPSRRGAWAMANVHAPVFRVLASDADALGEVLRTALARHRAVRLPATSTADPLLAAGGPWRLSTRPTAISPIVETDGDVDAWRAVSKKRWGAPLERFRRKMAREHDMRLTLNEPPADLARELERGFAVEGSGWKGRAGTAIVSHPETERFYRAIAEGFHAQGKLVCSSLELDGRMIAWDLSLLHAGRVFLLKTGYDEEFRRFAPGLVLRLSVVEDCFRRGHVAHELLGHVDDWKPKFATTERSHVEAHVFGRSPAGTALWAAQEAAHAALPLVRRLRSRSPV